MKVPADAAEPLDIAVIGAGITGLTTAHFLAASGLRVQIFEAQERPGGAIRTTRHGDFQVEHGPNSLLDTTPRLHELFAQIGIAGELIWASDKAKNRYIVRNGRLQALPMSPPAFFKSKLFSTRAKLRLLAEPFIGRAPANAEETLAQFVERRLGREFLDYAIDAFVAGVYAGVPQQLSVRDAFPKLHALEENYGSILKGAILGRRQRRREGRTAKQSARMFSFQQGLQTLTDALAAKQGEALQLGARLAGIYKQQTGYLLELTTGKRRWQAAARAVLLTVPAAAYQELEFNFDFAAARQALAQIYAPPVAMVFFGYGKNPGGRPLDGFGFLTPTRERRQILGTIWSSTLFPGRAPAAGVALTTFVGGMRQPDHARWSDNRLVDAVHTELHELLGIDSRPDAVIVQRWEKAIPQYRPGHQRLIAELERCEATNPGLFIAGNFRGGISVVDCIEQAQKLAERLSAAQQRLREPAGQTR